MVIPTGLPIPVAVRVHLAHAAVQAIADEVGADLLHIKGPALSSSLRPPTADESTSWRAAVPASTQPRLSTDADVLVRPEQAQGLVRAMTQHGWARMTRFETGSAFEHAATLWHDRLGYVDVHRWYPGLELPPAEAFAWLWKRRERALIAHQECSVPPVPAQRLLLILHGARDGGPTHPDVRLLWTIATPAERGVVTRLAAELQAEVALAAATGNLEAYAGHPSHDLWRAFAEQRSEDRLGEWLARFKAAPTSAARARLLWRSLWVNTDHLAMRLQRRPSRAEIAAEYLRRVRAVTGLLRRGRRAGRGARA